MRVDVLRGLLELVDLPGVLAIVTVQQEGYLLVYLILLARVERLQVLNHSFHGEFGAQKAPIDTVCEVARDFLVPDRSLLLLLLVGAILLA